MGRIAGYNDKIRFVCPECGSTYWGTRHCFQNKEEWIGHCNGVYVDPEGVIKRCNFEWKRTEDFKIFVPALGR